MARSKEDTQDGAGILPYMRSHARRPRCSSPATGRLASSAPSRSRGRPLLLANSSGLLFLTLSEPQRELERDNRVAYTPSNEYVTFYWALSARGIHPRTGVLFSRGDRVMAKYIEDLSQFLQSFGVVPVALLFLPVSIAAWARNVTLALATSLLSVASLMLFIAPASATSGLAIASGLGSFLVALESIIARGRMMALNKEIADLTSRVNQLESAEQRRLALQVKGKGHRK